MSLPSKKVKRNLKAKKEGTPKASLFTFNDLPEELQLIVFSYFTQAELCKTLAPVCMRWWHLSQNPALWKDITITKKMPGKIWYQFLLRSKALRSLKIESSAFRVLNCFPDLEPSTLKDVDLTACRVDNRCVYELVLNCPRLEILNIGRGVGSCVSRKGIDLQCVKSIVTLPNLRSLNLRGCKSIDDACVKIIAKECKHLELLNIEKTGWITDQAVCELAKLRQGTLAHFFVKAKHLTDNSMVALSSCEGLKTLCLSENGKLTDNSLKALSSMLQLEWLRIPNRVFNTQGWNVLFAEGCSSPLRILEIKPVHIDIWGLWYLAHSCTNLHILYLDSCQNIAPNELQYILDLCPQLILLELKRITIETKVLHAIPTKLKQLKYLSLIFCKGYYFKTINVLLRKMPNLKVNCVMGYKHYYYDTSTYKTIHTFNEKDVHYVVNKDLNIAWSPQVPCGFHFNGNQ